MTPVYGEQIDLEDLDLVAPIQEEAVPSFSLGEMEEEDAPVVSKRKSRQRRGRFQREEEVEHVSSRSFVEMEEESDDDDYPVLTPPPEREYGPPRDVFADLFPEDGEKRSPQPQSKPDSRRSESGQLTRGSKFRGERAESTEDESDPFAHFNQKAGRGSRTNPPRLPETAKETEVARDEEETPCPKRERGSRGRSAVARTRNVEMEADDEQSRNEEQEMMQLHRNIPGWDDAILPIVESNIAKHTNRPNHGNHGNQGKRKR